MVGARLFRLSTDQHTDILSPAELAAALNTNEILDNGAKVDEKSVGIDWVLKYTVVAHGRGVVADKGCAYSLCFFRMLTNTRRYIIRASLS